MPKQVKSNKRGRSRLGGRAARKSHKADSVKAHLLGPSHSMLGRVGAQTLRHDNWLRWLQTRLPQELSRRVSGVVEREGTLVIFTESAAWSARMRYAVAEIEPQIRSTHPDIIQIRVRVLPGGA